jgi:hypothetical protein
MKRFFILVLLLISLQSVVYAQPNHPPPPPPSDKINVYLDCPFCDKDFIRTEITYINYTTERTQADIHLLVTTANTGSGGTEYTLEFIGQKNFEGQNQKLKFANPPNFTSDLSRNVLVKHIQIGLLPYLSGSPMLAQLHIEMNKQDGHGGGPPPEPPSNEDKWNKWSFKINSSLNANGESQQSNFSLYGGISATRTTEKWKTNLSVNTNYNKSVFPSGVNGEKEDYITRANYASSSVVRSLTDHWSAKVEVNGEHHPNAEYSYSNIDKEGSLEGALEYSIFPYKDANRKKLVLQYSARLRSVDYAEETIYNKTSQLLAGESLYLGTSYTQPWGSLWGGLRGSHYFHDFSKNYLSIDGNVSWRVTKGLSLNLSGSFSKINDQVELPIGDASKDEILLRLKELATKFRYYTNVGISYRFGSFNNNVVNPRFGGGDSFFYFSGD